MTTTPDQYQTAAHEARERLYRLTLAEVEADDRCSATPLNDPDLPRLRAESIAAASQREQAEEDLTRALHDLVHLSARYAVTLKSESGHCCFTHTVVDTSHFDCSIYRPVCECFEEADAERICEALNDSNNITP